MKNKIFQHVASKKPKRNQFSLSRERKMSMDMGNLTPCFIQEIVPGDTFNVTSEALVRLAPLQAPMMHRVDCRMEYFFVPNRLVWNEWEDFISGGDDGLQLPVFPKIEFGGTDADTYFGQGSLADYFGLPTLDDDATGVNFVSALPFRAYQLIWNTYYRDQNLQTEIPFGLGSGELDANERSMVLPIRKRCWEKDYFTSALPDAQKGPEVEIPASNVVVDDWVPDSGDPLAGGLNVTGGAGGGDVFVSDGATTQGGQLEGTVEAITINELRRASSVQQFLELLMRGGSRYKEQIYNFFGVHTGDARLDRPEYLGGGKKPIVISEVLSTYNNSANAGDQPVGEMYGHGISAGDGYGFTNKTFKEHGYVIGIMSVIPRTAYSQGIHKTWTRFDKYDFYFPQFANLGEEPIKNKELFVNNDATDDNEFGYQQRYADYKYNEDSVHGDFRGNLDFWHMGRVFTNQPQLNSAFVTCDATNRVFQVTDPNEDKLWCQVYHHVRALRPMPYHSIPQLT